MMYKMVLVDLDGTLLNDEKNMSSQDVRTLQKLIDAGILVVIATGRRYFSAKRFSEVLDRPLIILANNGNVIREIDTDRIIHELSLDFSSLKSIYYMGCSEGLVPFFHVNGYEKGYDAIMLSDDTTVDFAMYYKGFGNRLRMVKSIQALEMERVLAMIYMGEPEYLTSFEKKIKSRYSLLNSHVVSNLLHFKGMLEIMNPQGSKWDAALKVAETHGIKPDEIVAIGDDLNDLFMVRQAGLGIAMKNASPWIKEAADIITPYNNNESGVGKILSEVFKDLI